MGKASNAFFAQDPEAEITRSQWFRERSTGAVCVLPYVRVLRPVFRVLACLCFLKIKGLKVLFRSQALLWNSEACQSSKYNSPLFFPFQI